MVEQGGGAGGGARASGDPRRRDAHATHATHVTGAEWPTWRPTFLLLTCEHGGHEIPGSYRHLFTGAEDTLRSHRGWDPGALALAHRLADDLAAPIIFTTTCRLLVELNRSLDQPDLFSEFTRDLPPDEKQQILNTHYHPYRNSVRRALAHAISAGERALHLSIHSFTPRLGDDVRTFEAGILFNPARPAEAALAAWWRPRLRALPLDTRHNEPYAGTDDGFTTALRAEFPPDTYAGLELEVRNDILTSPRAGAIATALTADLRIMTAAAPPNSRQGAAVPPSSRQGT